MTRLALEKTIDMSTAMMSVMHPLTLLITALVRERSGLETRRRAIVYCQTTRFVLPIAVGSRSAPDPSKRPQDQSKMRQDLPKMLHERPESGEEGSWNDFRVISWQFGALLG